MNTLLLAGALAGLCAPAQSNTTGVGVQPQPVPAAQSSQSPSALQLAQNDITISPDTAAMPEAEFSVSGASGAPLSGARSAGVRVALLLPLRSDALRQAAEVVRAGFLAGYEREQDVALSIAVVQTGDAPADILSAYLAAQRDNDIVVGPLSRSGVTAVAQSGAVARPTIALTQAEAPGDAEAVLPPNMLSMGLSVEQEARQVAASAAEGNAQGKAFVVTTATAWQRRAARAFAAQWQRAGQGMAVQTVEIGLAGGFLNANGLVQLKKRLQAEQPDLLFAALDAGQARQLREAIGGEIPMVGTSQLNPMTMQDWITAERMPEMNGVRLVDLPWQLQVDHPAVMAYPRPLAAPDQRRSADLERLYALGIDAFRATREIARNRSRFEIDGVTGKLRVDLDGTGARFERIELPAVYRDGAVTPLLEGQ